MPPETRKISPDDVPGGCETVRCRFARDFHVHTFGNLGTELVKEGNVDSLHVGQAVQDPLIKEN